MKIDKKWLNMYLRERLSVQYEIDKFLKKKAKEKGIDPGYHIIFTANGEYSILTSKPLGKNLEDAKAGLELWFASIPIFFKNAPEKLSLESPPLTRKQRRYLRIKAALDFLCAT